MVMPTTEEERKGFLRDLYADFNDNALIKEYEVIKKEVEKGYKHYDLVYEVIQEEVAKRFPKPQHMPK